MDNDILSLRECIKDIDRECERTRRMKILDAILERAEGRTFEFEERDITRPCVGTIHNGWKNAKPTGDKEFVIRIKDPNRREE
jgi:hypothetical protein